MRPKIVILVLMVAIGVVALAAVLKGVMGGQLRGGQGAGAATGGTGRPNWRASAGESQFEQRGGDRGAIAGGGD